MTSPDAPPTVTVTASVGWDFNTTVYVSLSPSSIVKEVGLTSTPRVSSSVMVTLVSLTVSPAVVPLTLTVSLFSSTLSSTGVNVKVPVPLICLAVIVMLKSSTAPKSVLAAVLADTLTVTATSDVSGALLSIAVTVTVVAPALSDTDEGDTLNAIPVEVV